jgi:hypothetical protein
MALPIRLIWNLQMKPKQKLSIAGLFCFGWVCIIISTIRVVQLGQTDNGVPAPSWLALWATIEASIGRSYAFSILCENSLAKYFLLLAVMIGCCPGLYRVVKAAISPSKKSYQYESYNLRGRGGSGMRSHRSSALRGTDFALNSLTGRVEAYQSTSAYRSSSPASSQEKLAPPAKAGNIMVNYGVAVTVEHRCSDYDRTPRFV